MELDIIKKADPEVAEYIKMELKRQQLEKLSILSA